METQCSARFKLNLFTHSKKQRRVWKMVICKAKKVYTTAIHTEAAAAAQADTLTPEKCPEQQNNCSDQLQLRDTMFRSSTSEAFPSCYVTEKKKLL